MVSLAGSIADTRDITSDDFTGANQVFVGSGSGTYTVVTVAASSFLARGAAGSCTSTSAADARTILNVENGADVTDATNVAAAGAVMDADYTAADEIMVGTGAGTHSQVTLAASQFLAKKSTGAATNVTAAEARTILQTTGYADFCIPAKLFSPTMFDGAAQNKMVLDAAANVEIDVLNFNPTAEKHAVAVFSMPDDWDLGTVKAKIVWAPTVGASAADVVLWGVSARACGNDDVIDGALGTEVEISDAVIAVGDNHTTAATAAITVGNTPAIGDMIILQIARKAADGSDTMDNEDASLIEVRIQYGTLAAAPSAW